VPVVLIVHPPVGQIARDFLVPRLPAGAKLSEVMLLIIAIVGTTVAPWQLFFQQSYVIDKRITPRFMRYEKVPPASPKLPNSGLPAKVAAQKAIIATAPTMTSTMPRQRSTRPGAGGAVRARAHRRQHHRCGRRVAGYRLRHRGRSTPASVCTALVSRPSGVPGVSTNPAASAISPE
jgi:hypothetical protein